MSRKNNIKANKERHTMEVKREKERRERLEKKRVARKAMVKGKSKGTTKLTKIQRRKLRSGVKLSSDPKSSMDMDSDDGSEQKEGNKSVKAKKDSSMEVEEKTS